MSTRRTTERRRAALAAAASLALHALLLAALLRAGEPRRAEPPRAPLVITLAPPPGDERPGAVGEAVPPEPHAPGPARAPAPPPLALRRAQGERQGNGRDRGGDEDARREPAPGVSALLGTPASPGASGTAGPDPLAPVLPRLGGEGGDGMPPAPAPGRGGLAPESTADAGARGKRRLDAWLGDLVAVDRARNSPETYWSGVRGVLERGPAVEWKVLEQGGSEDAVVSGTRAAQLVGAWLRAAEAYARRARGAPEGGAAPAADARLSLAARGLLDEAQPDNRLFVTELVTRVLVTVGDDGAVLSIKLAESSGNTAHDRLVLGRAQALCSRGGSGAPSPRGEAARDPTPPRELPALTLGAPPRSERRTLWTVRTRFELVPPFPVVGCRFDATFRPAGCVYPLKRIVNTDVRLEAVWDGGG